MNSIKYRTIKSDDNIVVITEDGGIADIHEAEPYEAEEYRQSTTEYYQDKFDIADITSDESIWTIVGEGKMYYNDWVTSFTDPTHIQDALNWLAPGYTYELDESIWTNLKEI